MLTIASRRIQFCAGHRVVGHENKCKNIHGHNWILTVYCRAEQLDSVGRVKDFGFMKDLFGSWIDKHWDHGMLLWTNDPIADAFEEDVLFRDMKHFILAKNPTAENMAEFLMEHFDYMVKETDPGVDVVTIELEETENCKVTCTRYLQAI